MTRKLIIAAAAALSFAFCASAQTASSLFWRKDSLQVKEIVSDQAVQYNFVGHHGPAVENASFALRVYFNDSGAIDLYSKSGKQMELLDYHWYPTQKQMAAGAGCDEYLVGKTVGVGGIALWDGQKEVKLVATKGRTARVGETKGGSFAEIISYGVMYKGEPVDISIRVEAFDGKREMKVTATELNGKKVQFLTGINYQKGGDVRFGKKYIACWGIHPADVSANPCPVGAGMWFKPSKFTAAPEKTADFVRIISKPAKKVSTYVNAASSKEDALNTADKFAAYMMK